jgi:reductive dehalogenase
MFTFLFILVSIFALYAFWFGVTVLREKVFRPAILGLLTFLGMAVALAIYAWAHGAGHLSNPVAQVIQIVVALLIVLFTVAMFIPIGRNPKALEGTRGMLEGEPEKFNQKDTAFNVAHVGGYGPDVGKKRWALQSQDIFGGIYWTLVMGLRHQVEGKVNPMKQREGISAEEVTKEIKRMAKYAGADMVGITTVKQDFTYSEAFSYEESKLETGPAVTTPVELNHKYVIVLAKEMDYEAVNTTLTEKNERNLAEVGKAYYEVAQVAVALASYIRALGYPARAHHLRNEQIFHVPHAVDAGLGEQGRFNYLITPEYGPRVRLSAVTTDLELLEDKPIDMGVQDFCINCRLCEINCPSNAIDEEKALVRGYRKWPQAFEKCFLFWVSGANTFACTLCLKICPWNKPRFFVHKINFFAASRSALARRVLYYMAIIFYGKRIKVERVPHEGEVEMPPETKTWGK